MPFSSTNAFLTGSKPIPTPSGGEVCAVRFTLALATGDLALNTIGAIGILPPGCVPVDVLVDGTDMDTSTAAMIFHVGLLNATEDAISTAAADGGGVWGATTAQNAAFTQRITFTGRNMMTVAAAQANRKLGVLVQTAPTTAAAGTLGVTLLYRPA
jgi:hypothetical protein